MAADGGCEKDVVQRMNKEYRAWGAPKSVLRDRGLGIKAKKCQYEGVIIVLTALHGAEAWGTLYNYIYLEDNTAYGAKY